MTYEWIPSPNFKPGRTQPIKYIVIHHWDDPAKKPKIEGVIKHFKDRSIEVAAHYVVSGNRVVQMVKETDTAWHAKDANPYTIGIEVDPNVPGSTYQTVARLVREIRERHGRLPLRKHSDFSPTSCPGGLDLGLIEHKADNAEEETMTPYDLNLLAQIANMGAQTGESKFVKDYVGRPVTPTLEDVLRSQANIDARTKANNYDNVFEALQKAYAAIEQLRQSPKVELPEDVLKEFNDLQATVDKYKEK